MPNTLKVVTWNIGGAHTINSAEVFDYNKEDLAYFSNVLKSINPDIVCLQESHTNEDDILASRLAKELDLPYVFDSPRSPSHIDDNYQLSNAIISRYPIKNKKNILLPDPSFELYFEGGKKARLFHTYLQTANVNGIMIANTHLQPLQLFGYSYNEGRGRQFAHNTEQVLNSNLSAPLIFAGDFNAPKFLDDFSEIISSLKLAPALDERPTDIKGNKMDYILYTPEIKLHDAKLVITEKADHYLGWAEFKLISE